MTALDDIAAERLRQIESEGWTLDHDDCHNKGELALAAAGYAQFAGASEMHRDFFAHRIPKWWPWSASWWKPKDRRRDLVKAGALIVAEIERLDRIQSS